MEQVEEQKLAEEDHKSQVQEENMKPVEEVEAW